MAHYSLRNVPSGVYPLFAVMGSAIIGVGYFLAHKSVGPDVVWSRSKNPYPWQTVKEHETTKIYDATGRFKRWSRFGSGSEAKPKNSEH